MSIAAKLMKEWLELFKKFRISGFKSCCNIAKQIATGLEIEIKLEIITFSRKEYFFYMMFQMNWLLMKTFFLIIGDIAKECINKHFELYKHCDATFTHLYNLHKLQEISEEVLKCHCIN